tara:strand:+ start:1766 stop:2710 length:945 start_codon:yes stop_codon:yes gene_type:complete
MNNIYTDKTQNFNDEIDLRELFSILWKGKLIVLGTTSLASIAVLIYSLLLPNIYESKALLVPVDSSSNISGAFQNYSSLAGLAGINLSSGSNDSNSAKAVEKLVSLSFFEDNIMPNIFLPDLMAFESWDSSSGSNTYKENIYNKSLDKWVRKFSYPNKQIPSAQESYDVFRSGHINLSEDKQTGFLLLAVKHQSPFIAKEWTELIIREINAFYRKKDKSETQKAVVFLNEQIAMANLAEIKQVIAELLQQETQKLTLIEANQSYVFDYIDPPAVMEKKSEPKRALICILGGLFGIVLGIVIVLFIHYGLRNRLF